jgi:N-acetylneuraminate synthase
MMLGAFVDKDAAAARLKGMKDIFEKSVVAAVEIPAGATLTSEMLAVKKPGTGIPARRLPELVGRRTSRAIPKNTMIPEDALDA